MQLYNDINLIGDLVNTLPVMTDLSNKYEGLRVMQSLDEGKWIYPLIPKDKNISLVPEDNVCSLMMDLVAAFKFGSENDQHMSQCHHHLFGLPTPARPIRPKLEVPDIDVPIYDYIFAPFSRSLPADQKWPIKNWIELLTDLTRVGFRVAVFGNSKYDSPLEFGSYSEFDRPMIEVLSMIKKCRQGVISVVTGISHLAYAMNTKNYLFCNQGAWGKNPDAICLETYIPKITSDEVLTLINEN